MPKRILKALLSKLLGGKAEDNKYYAIFEIDGELIAATISIPARKGGIKEIKAHQIALGRLAKSETDRTKAEKLFKIFFESLLGKEPGKHYHAVALIEGGHGVITVDITLPQGKRSVENHQVRIVEMWPKTSVGKEYVAKRLENLKHHQQHAKRRETKKHPMILED